MRLLLLVLVVAAALAAPLSAQWTFTGQYGVHFARSRPSQRVLDPAMYSAPGEASTVGARVARVIGSRLLWDIGGALSSNHSWSGSTTLPAPRLSNRTLFASTTLRWRPLGTGPGAQLLLGVGPAVMLHSGSGRSLLLRQTDVGLNLDGAVHVAVTGRVRLGIEVQNYQFQSSFVDAAVANPSHPEYFSGGAHWRSEWLMLLSMSIVR